ALRGRDVRRRAPPRLPRARDPGRGRRGGARRDGGGGGGALGARRAGAIVTRPFGPAGPTLGELARQPLASTREGYDSVTPRFDATPFGTPDAVVRRALSVVGEVDDALDLCCGTGAALVALRPRARRRLVGVDFSAGMLAAARGRLGLDDAPTRDPH